MVDVRRTLEVLLKGYPVNARILKDARFEVPNKLHGRLQVSSGWFFDADQFEQGELAALMQSDGVQDDGGGKAPVNHFTAVEAQVSYNQMAYVALACMAQGGHFEGVNPISLEEMNKKKFNDMVIRAISHDFVQPFDGTRGFDGTLEVTSQKLKRTPHGVYVIAKTSFGFDGNKAYGESVAAMRVQPYELTNKGAL